jgi:RNA polymerase sigma factor (TIGR02999 family)
MSDVTRILSQIDVGDPHATEKLLPLVYDELKKLAAAKLAQERPGQTLQATALVHEAYLRLVGGPGSGVESQDSRSWDSRGHFFAAAAEAMRRILVDRARQKQSQKQGRGRERLNLDDVTIAGSEPDERILAISEALDELAATDKMAADFVKLRYFAGLRGKDAAAALGLADRTADRLWIYARSWLLKRLRDE